MDLIATSPYRVCSFDEYIFYGNPDKWLYPQAYVGAGAVFNIDYVDNYVIATKDEIENAEYVNPMAEDNFYDQFTSIDYTVVCNEDEESIKFVVTDYVLNVTDAATMTGDLWFKVEAAHGYTLPQELQDRPYVLCQTFYEDDRPALVFTHVGMFTGETVIFSKQAVAACLFQQLSVADLPKVFEVYSYILVESQEENELDYEFYDLGDVTAWETETKPNYQFVDIKYVELVPITVAYAYEQLTSAESCAEFYERLEEIPDQVLASFSQTLKEDVIAHVGALYAIEHAELNGNATVNGTELDVSVVGKIPVDTVELDVVPVADQDIIDGGFGIKSADEIIIALDIKIVSKEDGTEWQPEEGYPVELSIDVASLGYEDGKVVRLHHKHGDEIETCDYLLVENGKVTFVTSNFSIFVIKQLYDVDGVKLSAGTTIDLEVGDDVLYYIDPPVGNRESVAKGTWVVTDDTTGAIHYTVYTEGESTSIGNTRANARWINIVALKKTPGEPGGADEQLITLTYKYLVSTRTVNWRGEESETISNTIQEETYKIRVKTPAATSANGGRRLYIKDMVNSTGSITA
ncbi:MAG: hypothetical protein IKV40_05800, partial [Clostridia bacterium]|nr:hypothetical protein [Clostridia bacterium]